jgi:multicomponent Na+:H+ antiporter subunit F
MNASPVNGIVETTLVVMISLAILCALIRVARGPSLADRVVALDLMTILGLGLLTVYAVAADEPVFLDIGIVLTLVTFLATIAFAYYMEKSTQRRDTEGGR